jgi:hypothetical protein
MRTTRMPDGGASYRFEITGRTREHLEGLAARHGMRLDEWVEYSIRPKPALRLKIRAQLFPVLCRLCPWLRPPA